MLDRYAGWVPGRIARPCRFAVDQRRAKDFSQDLHYQCRSPGGRHAWPLVLASLRAAFQQGMSQESPNADLNGRIAKSILSCFQPELFDSTGLFCSMWLMRLEMPQTTPRACSTNCCQPKDHRRASKMARSTGLICEAVKGWSEFFSSGSISPHPDPLPKGEGTDAVSYCRRF